MVLFPPRNWFQKEIQSSFPPLSLDKDSRILISHQKLNRTGSPFISRSSRSQDSWVWSCSTSQNYCQKEVQDLGRICSFRTPWEQKGSVWEALVIWKHRVAEAAARRAPREKQPAGTSRWCLSHRSPRPRDSKQGQTWGWKRGRNSTVTNRRGKKGSAARDKWPFPAWRTRNAER